MAVGIVFAGYVLMQTFLTEDPPLTVAPIAQTAGGGTDSSAQPLEANRPQGVMPQGAPDGAQHPDRVRRPSPQIIPAQGRTNTLGGFPARRGASSGQTGTGIASTPGANPGSNSTSPQGAAPRQGFGRPTPQPSDRSLQGSRPQGSRPAPLVDRSSSKRGSSDGSSPSPPPPRGSMNR